LPARLKIGTRPAGILRSAANLTAERAAGAGVKSVSKEELFRQADILTVHLVLNDRTRGLVGAKN
jgi:phosphoglycerate dehydrogenase-like enzyme